MASDALLILVVGCIVTLLGLFKFGPTLLNADTLLYTIISLQKVTLFYWGQNRLINLVPLIASPVTNPDANLIVCILLFGCGFIGLLAFLGKCIARVVFFTERRLDVWLIFSAILACFLAISSPLSIHTFIVEGQPYGLSTLLMGSGLVGIVCIDQKANARRLAANVAMILASGLNPSLLVVSCPVCAIAWFAFPANRQAIVTGAVLSIATCGAWLMVGSLMDGGGGSYTSLSVTTFSTNMRGAFTGLSNAFMATPFLGLICLTLAFLAILSRSGSAGRVGFATALVAGLAIVWTLALAQPIWVIRNGWHFRYFYPVILAVTVAIIIPIVGFVLRQSDLTKRAMVLTLLTVSVALSWPTKGFSGDFATFEAVGPAVAVAQRQQITLVVGDYWSVWPAVFLLLRSGQAIGIEPHRGMGNRDQIDQTIGWLEQSGIAVRALCLRMPVDACLALTHQMSDRSWHRIEEPCGAHCTMLEAGSSQM